MAHKKENEMRQRPFSFLVAGESTAMPELAEKGSVSLWRNHVMAICAIFRIQISMQPIQNYHAEYSHSRLSLPLVVVWVSLLYVTDSLGGIHVV